MAKKRTKDSYPVMGSNGKVFNAPVYQDDNNRAYIMDGNGHTYYVERQNTFDHPVQLDDVHVYAPSPQQMLDKALSNYSTISNDRTKANNTLHRRYNPHLYDNAQRGAVSHDTWTQEHPNLHSWGYVPSVAALGIAAYPFAVAAGQEVASTALGQAVGSRAASFIANPIVDMANYTANIGFAGMAGYDALQGKFTPETAMNLTGALANPRTLAGADVALTTLTGKSRDWMKPLVRNYIGEAYYNNIRPSGYANNDTFASSRYSQIGDMVKDIIKPKLFRNKVTDPNYRPKWFIDRNNPTVFEMFRNDAHRLSMGLDPHQELLPDGKWHSLYVKKTNGNYDVDWDYIRYIKRNNSNADGRAEAFLPTDFPESIRYVEGASPSDGRVVANDRITINGGYGAYIFNPNKVHSIDSPCHPNVGRELPTHFSTGDVTFMDTWDVQPIMEERSFAPKFTKSLTGIEKRNLPILSKGAHNIKNVELVDALGGIPFTQESKLPEQTIYWYAPKKTLESQLTKNRDKFQTLNWK